MGSWPATRHRFASGLPHEGGSRRAQRIHGLREGRSLCGPRRSACVWSQTPRRCGLRENVATLFRRREPVQVPLPHFDLTPAPAEPAFRREA